MIIDTEFNSAAQVPARESVEAAVLAEQRGFGCVWKGESNSRDPMVLLSAMAARTSRIGVGTAIYHIFGRTPVSLAIQAATLNDLSGGRLILGLGVANPTIAGWHGEEFDRPLRRMREYVDVLRAAYAGEKVSYSGEYFSCSGFKLAFDPSPHPLRVWLAALKPMMSRLAGKSSDGIVLNMANPPMIGEILENFREGAREAGRDPGSLDVVAKVRVSLNEDEEKARVALKKVLTFYSLAEGYSDMLCRMGWESVVGAVLSAFDEKGFHEARRQIPDEMLEDVPMYAGSDLKGLPRKLAEYEKAGCTRCVVAYVPSGESLWEELRAFVDGVDLAAMAGAPVGD